MQRNEVQLAIVIPVWRGRFLGEALESLRAQTDGRFRVYVCDDCSPDDIPAILDEHGMGLEIVYNRFSENLGGTDLIRQWERSLAQSAEEPWLWLFADDDEAQPETVSSFYEMRTKKPEAQLFCLDVDIIDEQGLVKRSAISPPPEENAQSFLSAILTRQGREVRGADHLFARSLFTKCGGFVWTPQAMYGDLASWVWFTECGGGKIKLPEGGLRWRQHPVSVSQGKGGDCRVIFLEALMLFSAWVDRFIDRYPVAIRRQLGRELFENYCASFRGLPGTPMKGEASKLFSQVRGFRNAGGFLRAIIVWSIGKRQEAREWPIVSIWCRWRYSRGAAS